MQLTALALWLNTAFAGFDEAVATAIHQLYVAAGWFFTPFLSFVSLLGKGGIFLILLSIALMLFRKTRRYGTTMLLALAIGALVTNVCFKPLVARPRPYTHDGSIFQQYWEMLGKHTESDKSFPSGHMTAAMAASLAVFLRGNKKVSWTALLFALAMGVSRIYLSVHYATDVLGGVTVPEYDSNYKKTGRNITISGDRITKYISGRDKSVLESNSNRVERQVNFLKAFANKTIEQTKKDITVPLNLYNKLSKNSISTVDASKITYLATVFLNGGADLEFVTVPGKIVQGEKYAEMYADEKALYELLLDVFYVQQA